MREPRFRRRALMASTEPDCVPPVFCNPLAPRRPLSALAAPPRACPPSGLRPHSSPPNSQKSHSAQTPPSMSTTSQSTFTDSPPAPPRLALAKLPMEYKAIWVVNADESGKIVTKMPADVNEPKENPMAGPNGWKKAIDWRARGAPAD